LSHISRLAVKITDCDALARACQELGVELRREQRTFRTFGGNTDKCEMAIVDPQNKQAYEIGLVPLKDGTGYEVLVDHWGAGGGLYAKLGEQFGLLRQRYGICAAESRAQKDGWNSWRQQQPDGSIRLVCEPKPQFATAAAGGGDAWGAGY
jgi:hypothetical protein